jgi:hypothetical protein
MEMKVFHFNEIEESLYEMLGLKEEEGGWENVRENITTVLLFSNGRLVRKSRGMINAT